jgi:uncharacterized membrane protein
MTAPAAVAWAAHWQWLHLAGSPLAFMGSRSTLVIFTAFALMEFIADLLPGVPARTSAFPLIARIVVGFITGSCLAVTAGVSLWLGGVAGVGGAVAGAFGGYHLRKELVHRLRVPDVVIAIPEDLIAVGLAWLAVFQFG